MLKSLHVDLRSTRAHGHSIDSPHLIMAVEQPMSNKCHLRHHSHILNEESMTLNVLLALATSTTGARDGPIHKLLSLQVADRAGV